MGIVDRARMAQRADTSAKDSISSTLVPVNPTVKRLRSVLDELSSFVIATGDDRQRRMSRLLSIVCDEAMDEIGDMDTRVLGGWMHWMACIIEWTANGSLDVLPDELIPFAAQVEGLDASEILRLRTEARNTPAENENVVYDAELVDG